MDKWREVLERDHFANAQHLFLARDRSRFRQTVLLIDDFLPQVGTSDALTPLWMTLRWLLANGFNVKFLAADGDGAAPRRAQLQQMGVQVIADNGFVDCYHDWLAENGRYIDWLWFFDAGLVERYRQAIANVAQARVAFSAQTLGSVALQRRYLRDNDAGLLPMIERWRGREQRLLSAAAVVMLADEAAVAEAGRMSADAVIGQLPQSPGGDDNDRERYVAEFDLAMQPHFSAAKQDAKVDE